MFSLTQNLSQFIPPAIILSVVVFLIHFFGKIISDSKPFADNRRWDIELSGIMFFVNHVVFCGILGWAIAMRFNLFGHWINLIIVLVISAWLLLSSFLLTESNYQVQVPFLKLLQIISGMKNEGWKNFLEKLKKIDRFTPLWVCSIIFMYILVSEYKHGNLLWFSVLIVQIFISYIILALNYSQRTYRPLLVNIYLIGEIEPLKDVLLLKANDDNLRLRQNNKVIILNKSRVEKTEISINQSQSQ